MSRATAAVVVLAAVWAALGTAGCGPEAPRPVPRPRADSAQVLGPLGPEAMRAAYGTPALVLRRVDEGGRHTAVQDTDWPADRPIDDRCLVIFVEGAGDTVEGFRWTGRLLAESPYGFRGAGPGLVVALLRWSRSGSPVADHLDREAQAAGAAHLVEMLEVHRRRHGAAGRVSVVGFSAGTRVIEMAWRGAAAGDPAWRPEALARVENVVFFVNPRDTHFGDRAAYVAPAGRPADLLNLLKQAALERRPRVGASAVGFLDLPTLTRPEQFDAVEALERTGSPAARAFKQVNVPVPRTLVPYGLFGQRIGDDDLDDYLNQAPNHYILVGRGPGGSTDAIDFRQYRAAAEEFVRQHVAAAALHGRLYRFDLKHVPRGADPLRLPVPIPVPWALFAPSPGEERPPPAASPAAPTGEEAGEAGQGAANEEAGGSSAP